MAFHTYLSRNLRASVFAFVALLAINSSVQSATVVNPGFEGGLYLYAADGTMDLAAGSNIITGWTVHTNNIAVVNAINTIGVVPHFNEVSLDLQGTSDVAPFGGVSQDIATVPGNSYTLHFFIGVQNDDPTKAGPASIFAAAGPASATFTNIAVGPGNQWQEFELDFVANAATSKIFFRGDSTAGGSYIGLDTVSVVDGPPGPIIPLPNAAWSGLLLLSIVIGVSKYRRRLTL